MKRFAPVWLGTFAIGTAGLLFCWIWTLLTPRFTGDLTRVALLSETAFAPQHRQPAVEDRLLANSGLTQADVLVVGDSFSVGRLWQSRLVAAGYRVASVHVRETVGFCPGIHDWIVRTGFRGHTVILQSVERELESRLRPGRPCKQPQVKRAHPNGDPRMVSVEPPPTLTGEPVMTGPQVYWNTRTSLHLTSDRVFGSANADRVRASPFPHGCEHFSNRACHVMLALAADLDRPALVEPVLKEAQQLSRSRAGYKVVWLVIPNKASVYVAPARFRDFAAALTSRGLGPDVFEALAAGGLDTYLPNDSHLSLAGYMQVGESVRRWMQRPGH